jgi:CHAT domain-containing protein
LQNKTLKTLFAGLTVDQPVANVPRTGKTKQDSLKKAVESELVAMKANLSSVTELIGNKFTFANLKQKLKNSDFQVLHLSTHGEFSSQNEKTYLVTASESGELINLEQLRDLVQTGKQNRPNAIQLLVFSACRTASGDRRATLGMSGAAVRSGANSTLSTLWSVDPDSTAEFMAGFYQELQTANRIGTSKTEVLQKAQIRILKKGGEDATPFFWSSFVLIGDWL